MIKEALQYIIGIQQPRVEEIKNKHYYFYNGTPMLLGECRSCDALEISTLTSLVEYIKSRLADDFAAAGGIPKMIVHVESETEVRLVSVFNGDMDRWEIAKVKARVPQISLNKFMDQESFERLLSNRLNADFDPDVNKLLHKVRIEQQEKEGQATMLMGGVKN